MVDDFGTGYSSLSQLKDLPVDGLKIDKIFLRDIEHDQRSRAIVRSVIALGRGLGMELVAEGVETQAQLDFMRTEGCQLAQGFFFGDPVLGEQVPALLTGLQTAAVPRPVKGALPV
jgi:EAL domain-containing protein (putative c-di-GMP-specific phosphodiesterase class I)